LISDGDGGSGICGHDFFKASWIMTRQPFGPLTAPVGWLLAELSTKPVLADSHTIDNHDALLSIGLQDFQTLHSVSLATHVSRHFLSRVDTTTTTLTVTS
jgi:hypothetical protein